MMIDDAQTPVKDLVDEQPVPDQAPDTIPADQPSAEPAPDTTPVEAEIPAEAPVAASPVQAEPAPEVPVAAVAATAPANPVQEVPAEGVSGVTVASDQDLFGSYMDALDAGENLDNDPTHRKLQRGERIEAEIVQIEKDKVFVNLGTKSEGIIPLEHLSSSNLETAEGEFKVGDKIWVVVVKPEGGEGNPIVSKKLADFEEVWDRIEAAHKSGEPMNALVLERVKGGLVVDVGVRGFVPATHVGSGKIRNIEKFVGQTLELKVIEIDRERKKVVLSNRQAEEQKRAAAKDEIFTHVNVGDVLDGTVRRLTDYGAFVDLGGVDGLLHISEMAWTRITHPKEMFKEGQTIQVKVLRLDPSIGKISLGHRQVLPDPWKIIRETYKPNQKLTVSVTRLVQGGAFIKLPEGAEAFLPLSEISSKRLRRPEEAIAEGQDVEVQIIDLKPDERRMVLSMRALSGGGSNYQSDYRPQEGGGGGGYDAEFRPRGGKPGGRKPVRRGGRNGGEYEDFEETAGRRGFATGGATIGERLGMLKGILGGNEAEEAPSVEAPSKEATEE